MRTHTGILSVDDKINKRSIKMKYLLLLFIVFICYSCKSVEPISKNEEQSFYKIKNIKKEKFYYIISAVRNDSLFKIIQDRDPSEIGNCSNIKPGKKYKLELKIFFPPDSIFGIPVTGDYSTRVRSVGLKGITIKISERYHDRLYLAKNLKGLCIIKD
ncbi:MAG: hypothetical protein LBQ60_04065 [Bacteroidales bacterium]|nr:hypothetical protein [Bacteroidales bacterium]